LQINQGILVNSESGCIVDVILEAVPIFINKESFLIVFVCQKEAGAVELYTVARIQNETFLTMPH
jgi:hypothetical protein